MITGRADKQFCSDMCRTSYHNRRYRREKEEVASINAILASNRRILETLCREGVESLPLSDRRMKGFSAAHYTSSCKSGRQTVYHCYEYSYEIKRRGFAYFCYICAPVTKKSN